VQSSPQCLADRASSGFLTTLPRPGWGPELEQKSAIPLDLVRAVSLGISAHSRKPPRMSWPSLFGVVRSLFGLGRLYLMKQTFTVVSRPTRYWRIPTVGRETLCNPRVLVVTAGTRSGSKGAPDTTPRPQCPFDVADGTLWRRRVQIFIHSFII
jgi:hypothetical protein